jgi:hypothetical protein
MDELQHDMDELSKPTICDWGHWLDACHPHSMMTPLISHLWSTHQNICMYKIVATIFQQLGILLAYKMLYINKLFLLVYLLLEIDNGSMRE